MSGKNNNLSSFYIGEQYNEISSIANRFGEYKEFKKKYSDLVLKKESNEKIWTGFLSKYFTDVLKDWVNDLIKKCKDTRIKQELSTVSLKLKTENLQVKDLQEIRKKLEDNEFEVNEDKKKMKWNFLKWFANHIISFILGIIGGILLIRFFGG